MFDILIIGNSLIVYFLCLFVFHFCICGLNTLSMESVFVYFYLIFVSVGSIIIHLKANEHALAMGLVNSYITTKMVLFSAISFLFIVLGMLVVRRGWGFGSVNSCILKGFSSRVRERRFYFIYFLLYLISLFVLFSYVNKIQSLAIIASFTGVVDPAVARSAMTNAFEGKYHWYKLFFIDILGFLSYIAFVILLLKSCRLKKYLKAPFFLVIFTAIFSHSMTGEKSKLAFLFLGYLFLFLFFRKGGKIFTPATFVAMLFISLWLYVAYVIFMPNNNHIVDSMIGRVFVGQLMPSYWYLQKFSNNFLYGLSFPNYGGILPFDRYMITAEMAGKIFPNSKISMTLPTVFWAEAYANFGIFGVLFFSFLMGTLVSLFSCFSKLIKNSIVRICFVVWCSLHFKDFTGGGISELFYDIFLFGLVGVVVVFSIWEKMSLNNSGSVSLGARRNG